jgi:hypothetical protein
MEVDEAFDPATQVLMDQRLDEEVLTAQGSMADFSRLGKRQRADQPAPLNCDFGPKFMDAYRKLQHEVADSKQTMAGVRACEIMSRIVGFHVRNLCDPSSCVVCLDD